MMTIAEARRIVGATVSGMPFGHTSKMPGYSYGLDAYQCRRGGELSKIEGSICNAHCYAKRNFYATWGPVIKNRERHQSAIQHPRWAEAMVRLFTRFLPPRGEPVYFRWLDSGDLPDVDALHKISGVAAKTPWVRHWMPTREYDIVNEWAQRMAGLGQRHPSNLVIRLSADFIGQRPRVGHASLLGLPTSTVHREGESPVQVSLARKHSVECKSYQRDHQCGPCRACWSPDVRNVSYTLSGEHGPKARRSDALRVVA